MNQRNIRDFSEIDVLNAPKFSFNGQTIDGKVVHVYDGDTITVVISVFGALFQWKCRMIGIDTPEIRTKNEYEKKMGLMSRDSLRGLIMGKYVSLECGDFDKYGRLLAKVRLYTNEQGEGEADIGDTGTTGNIGENTGEPGFIDVNKWMLDQGLARRYDGGKRMPWDSIDTLNKMI